jgi:uncharacterized membrane protein
MQTVQDRTIQRHSFDERPERRQPLPHRPLQYRRNVSRMNVDSTERTISLIAGGLLVAYMVRNRTPISFAVGALGAELVYRGVTGHSPIYGFLEKNTATGEDLPIELRKSVIVNRDQSEVYSFWRNLENLPQFMEHVRSVSTEENGRSHWIVHLTPGLTLEWDAEITEDRSNEMIAWRSLPGSSVQTSGSVHFAPATGNRGTQVTVMMAYQPPAGMVGEIFARMQKSITAQQIHEDMRRFKQILEAGEIPTTEGQSAGR